MKIAIKVSNEFEMGFLMGIYKNESLFARDGEQLPFNKEYCIIPYGETNWMKFPESNLPAYRDYEVISFQAWASLKGIEVPKCVIINQGNYKIEVYEVNCYVKVGGNTLYFTPKQIAEIQSAFISLAS